MYEMLSSVHDSVIPLTYETSACAVIYINNIYNMEQLKLMMLKIFFFAFYLD